MLFGVGFWAFAEWALLALQSAPRASFCTELRNDFGCSESKIWLAAFESAVGMIGKDYLTRQASTLLKMARLTKDRQVAVGLLDKAADLTNRADETSAANQSPSSSPPDVQNGSGL